MLFEVYGGAFFAQCEIWPLLAALCSLCLLYSHCGVDELFVFLSCIYKSLHLESGSPESQIAESCRMHHYVSSSSYVSLDSAKNMPPGLLKYWKTEKTPRENRQPPHTHIAKALNFLAERSESITCLLTAKNIAQSIFTSIHYFLFWNSCWVKGLLCVQKGNN